MIFQGPAGQDKVPSEEFDGGDEIDLRQLFFVLRRRWWVVALAAALGLGGAVAFGATRTPMFEAQAVVQRSDKAPVFQGVPALTEKANLVSEIEILGSVAVLQDVADETGLRVRWQAEDEERARAVAFIATTREAAAGTYRLVPGQDAVELRDRTGALVGARRPGGTISGGGVSVDLREGVPFSEPVTFEVLQPTQAVNRIRGSLSLTPIRNTDLIRIGYSSLDPEHSAAVVNAIVEVYQAFSAQSARDEARRRREVIGGQLTQLSDSLALAQQALTSYQSSSGTVSPENEGSVMAERHLAAETAARDLRFQVDLLAGVLSGFGAADSANAYRRVAIVGQNLVPTATELYGHLQEYESERSQLTTSRAGFTREAARVEVLDSLIASTKRDIRAAVEQSHTALQARLRRAESDLADMTALRSAYPERASQFAQLEQGMLALRSRYEQLASKFYEAQVAEQVEVGEVEVIDAAAVPLEPLPAHTPLILLLGLIAGGGLGVVLALLLESFDSRIRTVRDVEVASGLDLLAGIPILERNANDRALPVLSGSDHPGAEAFRMLRTAIQFSDGRMPTVIAVTSSGPGEGKSIVASNYAVALAKQGKKVLLIDADLRRPTIHEVFSIPKGPGLADVLLEPGTSFKLPDLGIHNLRVLPCGREVTDPAELLGRDSFGRFLKQARTRFDVVVIDTAPVLAVSDPMEIIPFVEGMLLVVRAEMSDRNAVRFAAARLRQVSAPLMGVVLNGIPKGGVAGYSYGYYGYAYPEYQRAGAPEPSESRELAGVGANGSHPVESNVDFS